MAIPRQKVGRFQRWQEATDGAWAAAEQAQKLAQSWFQASQLVARPF
jgi:hypothetical protein